MISTLVDTSQKTSMAISEFVKEIKGKHFDFPIVSF